MRIGPPNKVLLVSRVDLVLVRLETSMESKCTKWNQRRVFKWDLVSVAHMNIGVNTDAASLLLVTIGDIVQS